MVGQASEFSLRHYRRDISAGRPGIISIVYKDYCWVNWDNGQGIPKAALSEACAQKMTFQSDACDTCAGCWYNTGLDGRYDLIERPPRETRTLSQRIKKQELMAAFHRQNRQGVKKKPDQRESGSPAGVRTISAGQLSSAGNHVARSKEDLVSRH